MSYILYLVPVDYYGRKSTVSKVRAMPEILTHVRITVRDNVNALLPS
jgi:hypothetical protein